MAKFKSVADVQPWVDANGVEELRNAVEGGRFGNGNKQFAEAWLKAHDRAHAHKEAQVDRALVERSVSAAERSADSARSSAKWAMWAVLVALVALIVSAVQYLK